jgi:hypothetical protein
VDRRYQDRTGQDRTGQDRGRLKITVTVQDMPVEERSEWIREVGGDRVTQ